MRNVLPVLSALLVGTVIGWVVSGKRGTPALASVPHVIEVWQPFDFERNASPPAAKLAVLRAQVGGEYHEIGTGREDRNCWRLILVGQNGERVVLLAQPE